MRASGGAAPGTGGAPSSDDPRACTSDEECGRCLYARAPADVIACESTLACCGGPVLNVATCSANEAAFRAQCSDREYEPPLCPCISPGLCDDDTPPTVACRDGQCAFECVE